MASYIDLNDLGSFASINALWAAHPEGGQEGDYCTIAGVKYRWDKYDRMWVADPNFGPTPARSVTTFDGDVIMQNNLTVAGYIRAKGIKQPCLGLYLSEAALKAKWPDPEDGMWALVGENFPATLYVCETNGEWTETEATGGPDDVDLSSIVINGIKGWVAIDSTSELPENPTPEQQQKGYLLDTTLYVYMGEGGDTLDGEYKSAELKGAKGEKGDKGDNGVHLGDVALVNNLIEGGEESALTAEMGKVLGDVLVNDTKDLTSQMKAGYVMSGTANAGQTITLTETANANGHYIILDVVAGDKVWLKGSGYAGNRQYIFMDDNNVVKEIAAWNKTADTDWTEYTTPNDATKLVVNSIDASNYGVKIQNTPMTERVSKIEGKMADIYTPLQLAGEYSSEDCIAGYIAQGNNGAAVSIVENSSRRYIKLDIKKGDKIRVNVVPIGVATYIVTDSNDVILYQGTKPYTPFDSVLDITRDDAAHIYCNSTYNIIVQRYTLPTQGEYNEVIDNVVSHLDMVAAENIYDGEVEIGNFGGLTIGMWTSPISVEAGEAYTCYMLMGTNKYVAFFNGETYVSRLALTDNLQHISVPSGCNAMRFYDMDSKHSKECYVVKGSVDITHALRKKAAGYIDEFDLVQLTNKINLPLADKNIAILGDSITNVGYYPAEFFRITGYKNKAVYGRDGAAWTNDEYHTDNNIKERIDALENGITWTPDIIIVALGRNDNGRSPIGDIAEAMFATQETLNERATMYTAIRYGVKRLRSLYPNAKIFLQGIQWSKIIVGVTDTVEKYRVQEEYVLQYNEVIRNAADHMGCSFINVFADGVCEDTADRYLSDGLHDNAAGGVVHGRCVAAAVLAAYKD